jgi:hypothetical protein
MPRSYEKAKEPEEISALFVKAWMQRDADFLRTIQKNKKPSSYFKLL